VNRAAGKRGRSADGDQIQVAGSEMTGVSRLYGRENKADMRMCD